MGNIDIFDKIFIIDDKYEEVLPIIKVLGSRGISSIYWNGDLETKPKEPLKGIRLVILDMRFSYVTDSRTITTTLYTLLKYAISNDNGPYILCIWSKHDSEYLKDFKEGLEEASDVPQPYLILNIEKSKFVKTINEKNVVYDEIATSLAFEDKPELKEEILSILKTTGIHESVETIDLDEDIIEQLSTNLDEKLKEINSLSILLLWEHLANKSINNLVKEIANFSELDGTWDNNIKTLIQRLATANAGKSLGATTTEYILNSLSALNYMLPDELLNQLMKYSIDEDRFKFISNPAIIKNVDDEIFSISKPKKTFIVKKGNSDYKVFKNTADILNFEEKDRQVCRELYDKYLKLLGNSNFKLLCERKESVNINKPGNLYKVEDGKFLEQISQSIFKEKSKVDLRNASLVKLDISSSCDYAQNKLKRVRVLFGIKIKDTYFADIADTEDIYCTPELNIGDGETFKIVFNFHYITNESYNNLIETDKLFSFRELLLTEIKHTLSSYISRVGIINL
ncbi:hypothetical protein [Brassicibacter mesophilus]|uniref:hypothetical protein n=1 Tax=Brassicibacter mesophilus TaxID=745119 RepID=UPI003D2240A7